MKIIAESAFNHNGDIDYLIKLAEAAKEAKADFFTVQIYNTDDFCVLDYSKYDICKETELSQDEWLFLFDFCEKIDLDVIPCVLDNPSLDFAISEGFKLIKLHATDLLNISFLERISKMDVKVLLETQCASKRDINIAVGILQDNIEALFHGFSNYPTEYEDLNMNALDDIRERWPKYKIGFADHSLDTTGIPLMALAKRVDYLEKHITLSRNNRNYDWQVSLEPDEFSILVSGVRKYSKALGNNFKHPVHSETFYRRIMYKKYIPDEKSYIVKRSDSGMDYYESQALKYDKEKVIATVIARLKSHRLPLKIFKEFQNDLMIFDMITRVSTAKLISKVILATSFLDEDRQIIEEAKKRDVEVFGGDPLSVIDRMIDLAEKENAGAVFRITGDNPFTDPFLLDRMVEMYLQHNLDYVRVNNLPFGITAELFSTQYLHKLYYSIENPYQTEYLTWFVMLDKHSSKGCIDFEFDNPDIRRIGYSVDYPQDLQRCKDVLAKIGKANFVDVTLKDIVLNSEIVDLMDLSTKIKLPQGHSITYEEYLDWLNNMEYVTRKKISLKDLP